MDKVSIWSGCENSILEPLLDMQGKRRNSQVSSEARSRVDRV